MRRACSSRRNASALIVTLACMSILAITAAYTLRRISPRFQMTAQTSAWQEARLSAESGIDLALVELARNGTGFEEGSWAGWKQTESPTPPPTSLLSNLTNTLGSVTSQVPLLGSTLTQALAGTLSLANSSLSVLGNTVKVSAPIFLEKVPGAAAGNRPTSVDVQLWAIYPTPSPYYRWFRLRAMATCALPPVATSAPDSLEVPFRRYSLHGLRPQLRKDVIADATSIPAPSASRIIEVLVEPVLPFELAIFAGQSVSLGTNGTWLVDSYDSRELLKSGPGGLYPGKNSPLTQENGNIACNAGRPADAPYGPLIAANASLVRGGVATNGGDDPTTDAHENISGGGRIDASRIRDDFYREMKPIGRPTTGVVLPPPLPGQPFTAGSAAQPAQYLVSKNLGAFAVAAPADGSAGQIVIMVNGDLDIASGAISVPDDVTVRLFVRGNVDFHDRPINTDHPPAQLQIYGEDAHGAARTLRAYGKAEISAAFYGPDYDVRLDGDVDWSGAVAAHSFQMLGGGTGGFHYDEALGMVGAPIGFRIARYVEDVRE